MGSSSPRQGEGMNPNKLKTLKVPEGGEDAGPDEFVSISERMRKSELALVKLDWASCFSSDREVGDRRCAGPQVLNTTLTTLDLDFLPCT
jgi:hypothetical protein